ncbi:MAG: type III-A CRISPR-associated RAMP protein Csm3 [Zoogloeaceae bacterium]|jgi:CRISPR-associated protein Csm3|nr:type III-A CRISPR-associated RAMP protein Csm3 [Zoogloeaceae bacterium]
MLQLTNITTIEATLEVVTGLRIGAGDNEMHIGGVDNTVIKHPLTGSPYIPGSSLKGKMRSLLEWRSGAVKENALTASDYQTATEAQKPEIKRILQLFGVSGDAGEASKPFTPSRLSFWDCALDPEWEKSVRNNNQLLTEVKSENVINRISGVAEHPRNTERVPAGARFVFKLSIKQLADDEKSKEENEAENKALLDTVLQGLKLVEHDSLGGSGSRGYGKVKFTKIKIGEKYVCEKQWEKFPAFPTEQSKSRLDDLFQQAS